MELDKLNSYQREAVLDESKACVVNANVGSGKTTVLISKIQYLHDIKNVDYRDMVVLTFTNKAADEIKERLENLDDMPGSFGTFHSVALHLLRTYLPVESLGYQSDFQVIEPEEELEMALQLIKERKLTVKYKNRLKKRLEQEKINRYQDDLETLRKLLADEKVLQNKMTFSDLLQNTVQLIKNNGLPQEQQPKWIIIDEVQDSDHVQLELIDAMMTENTSLFAVGDPNQIIYSWRGSETSVFRKLTEKYDARELSLPVNYRSSSYILEFAKRFQQIHTDLTGVREQGNKIVVKKQYDSFQEADDLAGRIKALHENGVPYKEIAIFYRLQNQSEVFEKVFERNQIPYEVSLKKTIHDIPVLEWIIKLLRASVNLSDRYAKEYVLNHKIYGPGKNKKQRESFAEQIDGFQKAFSKTQMQMIKQGEWKVDVQNHIYEYYELDTFLHPTSAEFEQDKAAVYELFDRILTYITERRLDLLTGLADFLSSSALYGINILQNEINSEQDSVKLMTLHASKGLEFSYVFITGVNYGLIPLRAQTFEDEDEERRLFFVGITRAKDQLELSYYVNPGTPRSVSGPSPFIKFMPRQLIAGADEVSGTGAISDSDRFSGSGGISGSGAGHKNESGTEADKDSALNHENTYGLPFDDKPAVDLHELKRQIVVQQRNASIAFQGIVGSDRTDKSGIKTEIHMESKKEDNTSQIKVNSDIEDHTQVKSEELKKASHDKYGIGTVVKEDDLMITVEFDGYGEKEFMKGFGDITIL